MSRRAIETDGAPGAIGPYVQGVVSGGLLFTSMQLGLDPVSGELVGTTPAAQVRRCLENIQAIVEASGGTLNDVVKTTIFLTDIAAFSAVNDIYAEFFGDKLPARGVIEVSGLPKSALVAVEAIASIA